MSEIDMKKEDSLLKKQYQEKAIPALREKFGYKNIHQVPRLSKVVVSMGTAKLKDKQHIEASGRDLALITGQRPVATKARKSISNFKLREGTPVGWMVTLRNERMYEFLYKFVHIVAPRVMDFRGFKTKCDGRGAYSFGLTEQHVFPEVNPDDSKFVQGMNITVVTTANSDEECFELLKQLAFPFKAKPAR